jgi:hypothetical protein
VTAPRSSCTPQGAQAPPSTSGVGSASASGSQGDTAPFTVERVTEQSMRLATASTGGVGAAEVFVELDEEESRG